MPKNASGLERAAHEAERGFYDMTGGKNVYDYITTEGKITGKKTGQITALEYLQKSTGVFNGDGMISAEQVEEMKARLKKNEGNIYHGFISLSEEQSYKIDTPEKCIGLIKNTFGQFLEDAKFNRKNIDLMCALHLDKPHHLHIHFVFWEKEPTYKTKKGTFGYRRKGKIDMTAINNLFVRIGLYIDSDRDKLYKTRVEAIRTLRGMTSVKAAMGSSDEIRKEILSLAKDLPKTGRLSYGSKDMEAYVGRVDKIVDMLIGYQGQARRSHLRFLDELEKHKQAIKNICGTPFAFTDRNVKVEEVERDLPKYHNKIDEKTLSIIQEIEADYKRRQGNLVLKLAKFIKPEIYEKPRYGKTKPNDKNHKRRLAMSRRKIKSLFGKFLLSFGSESELLERDFSHRLQDIEKEMEEQRKRENGEYKEVNYKD